MAERLTVEETIEIVDRLEGRRLNRGVLQYYTEKVHFRPREVATAGPRPLTGARRGRPCQLYYSPEDVALLRWMVRLSREGVELRQFRQAIDELRKRFPRDLANPKRLKFLVVNNKGNVAVSRDSRWIELTGHPGQVLLRLSFGEAQEAVAEARVFPGKRGTRKLSTG